MQTIVSKIRQRFYRRSIFVILILISTVGCLRNSSFGQSNKCNSDHKDVVKFKVVQSYKTDLPPYIRSLRIVVKQENFNRDYMLRLAKTLRQQFCTDNEISVMI